MSTEHKPTDQQLSGQAMSEERWHGSHHHGEDPDDPCRKAMEKIQEFLHQELDERTADLIREHLASCAVCEDQFEVEATITQLIRRTRHSEQVSETLRARLSTLSVRQVRH